MTVTLGINGFGRIGRCTLAHITEARATTSRWSRSTPPARSRPTPIFCATTASMAASAGEVRVGRHDGSGPRPDEGVLDLRPAELDWEGCDVVLECTGKFNDRDAAAVHLSRGAKRVLVSPRPRMPTRPSSTA
jgi:glyceraldehyde 3-phosphate dehydrogenase